MQGDTQATGSRVSFDARLAVLNNQFNCTKLMYQTAVPALFLASRQFVRF
jgi:hypothetical protein